MRGWMRAALTASVLLFVLGLAEDFENPKAAAVRVCGFALLAMAAARGRALRTVAWTPIDVAVIAWLWIELLATLLSSAPALSLVGDSVQREGFVTSLAMAGVYLGARLGTRDAGDARRTLDVALLAITLASAYAVLQALGLDWIHWAPREIGGVPIAVGRPGSTLGHATILGVISAAGTSAALACALAAEGRRRWWAAAVAIGAGATIVTLARAAWLGLVAGALVAVALAMGGGWRPKARSATLWSVAALAAVAVALLASGWGARLSDRLASLLHPERGSGASRLEIWRSALAAWRARPWFGWGPDAFGAVFSRFQSAALWRNEWGLMPFHAHSIYLETLATRGVMGLLSAAAWAVALGAAARSIWRRAPDERPLVTAMLAALASILVAGGFGALGLAGQTVIMVFSGTLGARASARVFEPEPGSAARVSAFLAAGLAAVWGFADLSAAAAQANAQVWLDRIDDSGGAASRSACERALASARWAARFAPMDDRIACLHADALFAMADVSLRPWPPMLEATAEARRAIRLVPARAGNWLRLGRLLAARSAMGDGAALAEGRAGLEVATRLAPADARVLVECARMELIDGDADRAVATAERAARLYPDDGSSLAMLGRALLRRGEAEPGMAALRRSLAADWHGDLGARAEAETEVRALHE